MVILGITGGVLVGVVAWYARGREASFQTALGEATSALGDGRYRTARARLIELDRQRPGRAEVAYHLGLCEQALGNAQAARTAWERVPESSPQRGWSLLHATKLDLAEGRLGEAEARLREALARPGSHRAATRWELVLLLRLEGRLAEASALYRQGMDELPDAAAALTRLYRLDHDPFAAEGVRRSLEVAAAQQPDEPRLWLAQAHLALRQGDLATARRLLDRCLARNPEDAPTWTLILELARAEGDRARVRESLEHVPAPTEPGAAVAELAAWLARQEQDSTREGAALERLVQAAPGRIDALERLAERALDAGDARRATALRQRKQAVEAAREAYKALLASPEARARAREAEALARQIGRPFDAACWQALAAGQPARPEPPPGGRTLALVAPKLRGSTSKGTIATATPAPQPQQPPSPIRLADEAARRGLAFTQQTGHVEGQLALPETGSGGIALLDHDGDGWLDVYAVQGGAFPPSPGASNGDRLFRNRGDGTFEDVSDKAGLARLPGGYGHGATAADFDNDGDADLLVTRWRGYALYRNKGDGTFEDATEAAGLAGDRDWPTSAAFSDLDNDGDLDLYVCHYLAWDERGDRTCLDPKDPTRYACNPIDFPARPDHLFRNDDGRFVDVTAEAGIVDANGRGLGVLAADLDEDGRVDLFVANDMTANYLFRNLGGMRFEEVAHTAGVAANAQGGYQAGMGVACGDIDGDARLDLLVTNYYAESTSLFQGLGQGLFVDRTASSGLGVASRFLLGFGIVTLDADNDSRLDVLTANGHVHDGRPSYPWKMPAQLLRNLGHGKLADASAAAGPALAAEHLGRGLAAGDLDNDGRLDAVLVAQDEPLVALVNQTEPRGPWITLALEGSISNRDAIGAVVTIEAGGRTIVVPRIGGGSFQSASEPRLHAGLGAATTIDRLTVRWPTGSTETFTGLAASTGYRIREGSGRVDPLPGFLKSTVVPPDPETSSRP